MMEKDYYQSNVPSDSVRLLNEGLFQIQSEIDNIKAQVQQGKQQRKTEQAFVNNSENIERQYAKDFENFSNRNDEVLNRLFEQMASLSNEVRELRSDKQKQMTSEEIAKAANVEFSKGLEAFLNEFKTSIFAKVEIEAANIRATQRSVAEIAEEKIENQKRIDQLVENLAIGVEGKLELKFSEMFFELNGIIQTIKLQKNEQQQAEIDKNKNNISEVVGKVVNRLNELTLKMDSLKSAFEKNAQSIVNARESYLIEDNQRLIDRFDKLAEYVAELVGGNASDAENQNVAANDGKSKLDGKLNELTELINSRKDMDFRPIYETLNELDQKLADVKLALGDRKASSLITSDTNEDAINGNNENTTKILNEIIPRIIRESVANSIVNVDDSESKGLYEKLTNQMNVIFSNEEQKFDELSKQIAGLKGEISFTDGLHAEASDGFRPNEIEETLSSLRGELMSLSKLISDAETDDDVADAGDGQIPKAISDATKTLDKLTKGIL